MWRNFRTTSPTAIISEVRDLILAFTKCGTEIVAVGGNSTARSSKYFWFYGEQRVFPTSWNSALYENGQMLSYNNDSFSNNTSYQNLWCASLLTQRQSSQLGLLNRKCHARIESVTQESKVSRRNRKLASRNTSVACERTFHYWNT